MLNIQKKTTSDLINKESSVFHFFQKVLRRNNIIWIIILNLLFFFLILQLPVKAKVLGDMDFHIETKVISGFLYGIADFEEISITKAPGPVLFYAIPYFLAGENASDTTLVKYARLWMCLLSTLLLALSYRVFANSYSYEHSNLFGLFTFIIPLHVYYSLGILAEGMAFLSMLLVLIGFALINKKRGKVMFTLGLIFLILSRPNTILCLPLIFIGGLYFWKVKETMKAKSFLISTVVAGLTIIIISASVSLLPNKRKTLDQEAYLAYVMHIGRFQFRTEELDWRFWDGTNRPDSKDYQNYLTSVRELEKKVKVGEQSKSMIYYEWIIKDYIQHPFMTIKQFFVRIIFGNTLRINSLNQSSFSLGSINGTHIYYSLMTILNLLNYTILALAFFYLSKNNYWSYFWPLIAIVLAIWLFNGIVYIEQRYLFPSRSIFNLLASFGLILILKNKHEQFES